MGLGANTTKATTKEKSMSRCDHCGDDHSAYSYCRPIDALAAYREVAEERDRLRKNLESAERELERWRHGVPIEGDYVCPNALQADVLTAENTALRERKNWSFEAAHHDKHHDREEALKTALRKYGDHKLDCRLTPDESWPPRKNQDGTLWVDPRPPICTCGYDDALIDPKEPT